MTSTNSLTEQQLAAIDAREKAATEGPWCTDSWEIYQGTEYLPGISQWIGETCRGTSSLEQDRADAEFVAHARTDVRLLLDEVRRLSAELAVASSQAIDWATAAVDAKLTAEPDHNRASALYELLLHLRGELPCTCARSQGLHEQTCRKYVPGHELLSPVRALAAYRNERAAEETHVGAGDGMPAHEIWSPRCEDGCCL
jgi:hypothetical protein